MHIFCFSQAEIAECKFWRKQAKGKIAEIIPDPDFGLINKDRGEFEYPQRDAELHYPVLKQNIYIFGIGYFYFFPH